MSPSAAFNPDHDRRWWILGVLVSAQLMLTVDVTIVNIALPAAQADLGLSDGDRAWVITAYALPFGGLLLLGGRIADVLGRRRSFVLALLGFAAASALGGLAWSGPSLFAARALQGAFGALMAPAVLSTITLLFPGGPERARAFGAYTLAAAAGGATGLLLGGLLTETLSWRWCLLVNAPVAALAALAALRLMNATAGTPRKSLDIVGAATVTTGLVSIVFASSRAVEDGWGSAVVLTLLVAGALLLVGFFAWEARAADPLLPIETIAVRSRLSALSVFVLAFSANIGMLLIAVIYLQDTLGWTALESGLGFAPYMGGAALGAAAAAAASARVAPGALMCTGGIVSAAGALLLSTITPDPAYTTTVLPGLLLMGSGAGLLFVPASSVALVGVPERDAGVMSGAVNAGQQIGAAIGPAALNTIAISAAAAAVESGATDQVAATVDGFGTALLVTAGILLLAALVGAAAGVRASEVAEMPSGAPI